MYGTDFKPGKPGRPVPLLRRAEPKNEERGAGPPAILEENIEKSIDVTEATRVRQLAQPYHVRWLKQRYGLSASCAAVVADICWGGA